MLSAAEVHPMYRANGSRQLSAHSYIIAKRSNSVEDAVLQFFSPFEGMG